MLAGEGTSESVLLASVEVSEAWVEEAEEVVEVDLREVPTARRNLSRMAISALFLFGRSRNATVSVVLSRMVDEGGRRCPTSTSKRGAESFSSL